MAGGALVGIKIVHPVENAQQRRLAAARRADEGRHLALIERHVDVLQRAVVAVKEIEIADRDLLGQIFGASRRMGDGWDGDGCYAHDDFLWAARIRATMLSASTASVMIRAPVQASFCQSL